MVWLQCVIFLMISCSYLSLVLTDMQGKLIVIDGGDGAGKATQTKLLIERLRADGHEIETLDFPQYTQNTFGQLLRTCLDGYCNDFMNTDPRIVSTIYAADRFESKPQLEQWLAEGKIVVLDRYVSSNMMHQGAKISDEATLKGFLTWLDNMEHNIFKIPRPDLIFYFDIPFEKRAELKAQAIIEGKNSAAIDVAEADQNHQRLAEERARQIVEMLNNWNQINCCCNESGGLRSREDIHDEVYKIVSKII